MRRSWATFVVAFLLCGLVAWPPVVFGVQRWSFAALAHLSGVIVVVYLRLRGDRKRCADPWGVWELRYETLGHVEVRLGIFEGRYSAARDECELRALRWHWKRGDRNEGLVMGRCIVIPAQAREYPAAQL